MRAGEGAMINLRVGSPAHAAVKRLATESGQSMSATVDALLAKILGVEPMVSRAALDAAVDRLHAAMAVPAPVPRPRGRRRA